MKTNRMMVGVIGGLGLAACAQAALCPPEECAAAPEGAAVRVLLAGGATQGATPQRFLVHASQGGAARVADVVRWQPADAKVRTRTVTKSGEGERGSYIVVNDKDTISLTIEDGKVLSLDRNGKKIPPEKVKKSGNRVTIVGDSGETVYEFDLGEKAGGAQGQGWAASGEGARRMLMQRDGVPGMGVVAMEPPKAMIGVQLGEANGMLLGHFGIKPGEATLVTGVYDGLPAGKAGVKPYDLIVAVNGESPAGQTQVREALRGIEAGEKVRMTVIHKGERKNVELTLVEYNEEVLAESKLDAVEADGMAFALGAGSGENVYVAPGVGQLRNFRGQDAERMREFAESWRAQAEEYAKGFAQGVPKTPDAFSAPMAPSAPAAPRSGLGSGATDERWQRIEERLERLERMLERLAEQRRSGGGGAGGR